MRRFWILLAAALLAPLPASAQVTEFPNLLPQNWSAEATGLEDRSLGLLLPCGINRISANLRLSNPTKRPQIVPTVGLIFALPMPRIEQVILRVETGANGRPELTLRKHGGPKLVPDIRFAVPVAYGKDVPVVVRWHPDGRIDVTAGGRTRGMALSAVPADVEFFVQGGKGDITNLRTGWEGAGQAAACARPLR